MKCVNCGCSSGYKQRLQNRFRCGRCGEPFAYEPRRGDPLTDGRMERAIRSVSGQGAHSFTARQLWYAATRRPRRRPLDSAAGGFRAGCFTFVLIWLVSAVILGWLTALFGWEMRFWYALVPAIILTALSLYGQSLEAPPSVPYDAFFHRHLSAWERAHGPMEGLVRRGDGEGGGDQSSTSLPSDLGDYSFDRCLVTQRDEVAEMLVANRFHVENSCVVVSEEGFPAGLQDELLEMVRRNPSTKIFTLHDASVAGCGLPLRVEQWFPERPILDLGMRPKRVMGKKLADAQMVVDADAVGPELREFLDLEEVEWLSSGKQIELAWFPPAALLRVARGGLSRVRRAEEAALAGASKERAWHDRDDNPDHLDIAYPLFLEPAVTDLFDDERPEWAGDDDSRGWGDSDLSWDGDMGDFDGDG